MRSWIDSWLGGQTDDPGGHVVDAAYGLAWASICNARVRVGHAIVDANEEFSGLHSTSIREQAHFVNDAIAWLLRRYEEAGCRRESVLLLGKASATPPPLSPSHAPPWR